MAKVALCFLLLFVVLVSLEVVQGAGRTKYSSRKPSSKSYKNRYSSGGGKGTKSGSSKYEKQSYEDGYDGSDGSDSGKGEGSKYKKMDKYKKKNSQTYEKDGGSNRYGQQGSQHGKNMKKYQMKEYKDYEKDGGSNKYRHQGSEYDRKMDKYQDQDYKDGGYSQHGGENSRGLEKRVDRMEDTLYDLKREMRELTIKIKILLKLKLNIKLILKLKLRIEAIEKILARLGKEVRGLTERTKKCCRKPKFHGIPKTCQDIYASGAQTSGFYMVQDEDLKAVFCNFKHACKGNVTQIDVAIIVTIKIKIFIKICLNLILPLTATTPTPLKFGLVSGHPENAYDPSTGIFHAPTDGIYLISCIFIKAIIKIDVILHLFVDLQLEAIVKGVLSLTDQLSLTLATQVKLRIGAEVIIKLLGGLGVGSHCCQISLLQDSYTPIGLTGPTYY